MRYMTLLRRAMGRRVRDMALRRDRARGVRMIHYLHIGKTGGTAVKAALEASRLPGTRIVLHSHRTSLEQIPAGESCVFFVRDPVSRFVSGFFSRQRQGRPRHDYPWSPDEKTAFERFETPNQLALALSGDSSERAAASHAMRSIQHVRDSYWQWLLNEDYLRARRPDILFVGSQEHLGSDFTSLCDILGIRVELPSDETLAHRNPAALNRSLDPEATHNLKQWYSRDYACLRLLASWFPHLPSYTEAVTPERTG